jgi:prepilin-type N-terminal cleavage/methylation domain-containing protein
MSTFSNFYLEFDMKMVKKQGGFTLVEIAIVLVIVGLLLAGVLKGQELIENSKIKSIANEMKSVQAAYNAYIDRYKVVPGSELAATMTARGWTGTAGAAVDGVLTVAVANTFTNNGDSASFWRALRASGFFTGDPTAVAGAVAGLPRHSGGGLLGVTSAVTYGQSGVSVCAAGLSTKQAAGIDILLDGSLPATQIGNNAGSVRGATGAANPLAPAAGLPGGVAYSETAAVNPWTLCIRI